MEKIDLIIEKESKSGDFWGRIIYENDLLLDSSETIDDLQKKMKTLLHDFHEVDTEQVEFELFYDLTAFFQEKQYLNLSAVADKAGINRSLMAQYSSGIKIPSLERANAIEQVIHMLGNDLRAVKIAPPKSTDILVKTNSNEREMLVLSEEEINNLS